MFAAIWSGNGDAQTNQPEEQVTFELNARPSEGAVADPDRRMVVLSEPIPNSEDRIPDGTEFSLSMTSGRITSRGVQSCGGYIGFTVVPPDKSGDVLIQATSDDNTYQGELLYTFVGVPSAPIYLHALDKREVDGEVRVTLSTGPVTDQDGNPLAGGRLYAEVSGATILSDDDSVISLDADGVGFLEVGVLNEETGDYAAPGEEWEFEVSVYVQPNDEVPLDTYTLSSDANIFSDWESYDEANSDKAMQWEHAEEGVRLGLSAHPRTDGEEAGNDLQIIGDGVFRTYPGAMWSSEREYEVGGWNFEYYVEAPEEFQGSVRLHYDLEPGEDAPGDPAGEVTLVAPAEGVGASWNPGFKFLAESEDEELPDEALSVDPPPAVFNPYATGEYGFTLKAYDEEGELLGGPGITVVAREPNAPDVEGEVLEDAETILQDEGLVLGEVTDEYSFEVPENHVISQSPAPGEPASDSQVDLVVSEGVDPDAVHVPSVVGMRRAEAEALLQEEGLNVGDIRYEDSSIVLAGRVISQSPSAGEPVLADSQVALVVSEGLESGIVRVPSVLGLRQDDAEADLEASGFQVGAVRFEASRNMPEGYVLRQDPWGGTPAAVGSEVSVWISVGASEPPDLVEMWPPALVAASEGKDIVLSVLVYAEYEDLARVRWIFTETGEVIESEPDLVFEDVDEQVAGTYVVEVTHPSYPWVAETHMVEVRFMDFTPGAGGLGLTVLALFCGAYGVRRIYTRRE
ncbi:MAG: PASTA domain-containing protein [Candidatus Hydrogenedentota bacterium]